MANFAMSIIAFNNLRYHVAIKRIPDNWILVDCYAIIDTVCLSSDPLKMMNMPYKPFAGIVNAFGGHFILSRADYKLSYSEMLCQRVKELETLISLQLLNWT